MSDVDIFLLIFKYFIHILSMLKHFIKTNFVYTKIILNLTILFYFFEKLWFYCYNTIT